MIICNYFVFFLTMATFVSITNLSPAPILQSKILSVAVPIGTSQEVPPSLKVVPTCPPPPPMGVTGAENTAFVSFQGTGFRIYDPIQELVSVDGEIWSQQKNRQPSIFGCVSMGAEGSNQKHVQMNQRINRSIKQSLNQSINQSNKSTKTCRASNCYQKKVIQRLTSWSHFLTTPHFLTPPPEAPKASSKSDSRFLVHELSKWCSTSTPHPNRTLPNSQHLFRKLMDSYPLLRK